MNTYNTETISLLRNAETNDIAHLKFRQTATNEQGQFVVDEYNFSFDPQFGGSLGDAEAFAVFTLAVNEELDQKMIDGIGVNPMVVQKAVISVADEKAGFIKTIDDSIADIITKHTRFQMGYVERETAAIAFLAPNNVEPASIWITRFADNIGMSHTQAATIILGQATMLRNALRDLDNLRMDKYLINGTITIHEARLLYKRICDDRDAIEATLK